MLSRNKRELQGQIYLALHNIRSTHNVGSIFRTADAAGVSKIFLCGYTPAPIDRFGRERSDITKVSLGAEKDVAWESVEDLSGLIEKMKRKSFLICALEQSEKSIDYKDLKLTSDILLIVGNEVGGIEKDILDVCDVVAEIPMLGKKESLNVSVATGIILYGLIK